MDEDFSAEKELEKINQENKEKQAKRERERIEKEEMERKAKQETERIRKEVEEKIARDRRNRENRIRRIKAFINELFFFLIRMSFMFIMYIIITRVFFN